MTTSPKVVRIDLLKQSNKNRTSPRKKSHHQSQKQVQQFSFSADLQTDLSSLKSSNKGRLPSPLAKRLFGSSPHKSKSKKLPQSPSVPSKGNLDKIRQKYRNLNPNYEQTDQQDRFFKKSIERLKSSFFRHDSKGKEATKKILKAIGKYAEGRSKNVPQEDSSKLKALEAKYKNIPVELYGFKHQEQLMRTREERQQVEKGTFLDFERAYELTITHNNQMLDRIDYKNEHIQYLTAGERDSRKELPLSVQEWDAPSEAESIGEREIDIVCEIFQYCDKLNQSDKIALHDLQLLVEQFKRRYSIKEAQQSGESPSKLIPEPKFSNLLRDFGEDLKVIFYRRQENDIYDTLYYLRETNHLQLVCEDFAKIKLILNL